MITQIDFNILNAIQELRTPFLDGFFSFITHLGDKGFIWIVITLILFCFKKTRKCSVMMAITPIIGTLLGNIILKNLIGRVRPFVELSDMKDILIIAPPSGYSFPSGHTLSSFECAVAIFLNNKKWGMVALGLAALIGFSRNYLYVHYPTDVLAGALLGVVIAFISKVIYEKFIADKKIGKFEF